MIIVEGPDGSGKSTLIQNMGYEPLRFRALRGGQGGTAPDGTCATTAAGWGGDLEAPIAYARPVLDALAHPERRLAFDRFHLSETVYGPMLRGASGISDEELKIFRRLLLARGVPVVVCLPPYHIALLNVCTPGRERPAFQTPEFLWAAYGRWSSICFSGQEQVAVYNYTRHDRFSAVTVPLVNGFEIQALPTLPQGLIGSPTARYLVLGRQAEGDVLPFFSMRGAAGALNRALWEAGFRESELAFGFAPAKDTGIVIPEGVRDILFLGDDPYLYAHKSVRVHRLKHPSQWKRTHARQVNPNVQKLYDIRHRAA